MKCRWEMEIRDFLPISDTYLGIRKATLIVHDVYGLWSGAIADNQVQ